MQRNIGVIINPVSGRKDKSKLVRAFQEFMEANAIDVSCHFMETKRRGHATELATQAEEKGYTDLVVIGGDGTINEVVNGLQGQDVAFSCLPTGTGNDFVKSLEWPQDFTSQLQSILYGKTALIDLGLCNDRKFANTMGLGFDGKVVDYIEKNGKHFQGHLSYLYTVMKVLFGYKEPEASMQIDDHQIDASVFMAAINNGKVFGGGFKITPEATVDDGLLDLCLIEKLSVFERLLNLPKVQRGVHHHVKGVSFYQLREMQVKPSTAIVGQIDGEYLGHPPFDIKVLPRELRVRLPHELKQ